MMKKLPNCCILLFLAITIFSACKHNNTSSSPIVGSWELSSISSVTIDSTTNPPTITPADSNFVHGHSTITQFNANNTYTSKDYSATPDTLLESGTYKIITNNEIVTMPTNDIPDTLKYTISGKTLSIPYSTSIPQYSVSGTIIYTRQ